MKRRDFLQRLAALGLSASLPARLAFATPGAAHKRRPIVFVFQRGACDGLSLLPPLRDEAYRAARPEIAIPRGEALKLTADIGLHPACAPLNELWAARRLAFVPLAGSPDGTRSHFDAQDYLEIGTPDGKHTEDGFWNRALAPGGTDLRAVALQCNQPRSLQGPAPSLTVSSLGQFKRKGILGSAAVSESFEGLYEQALHESPPGAGGETFSALKTVEKILNTPSTTPYPTGRLAKALREVALLIKANVGLELAITELGGWDSHVNQGATKGSLANHFAEWSGAIAAFARDLGPRFSEVLLVSVTEFGRTVKQNGSGGTDHGHGSVFTFAGGSVAGGVLGAYPELREADLFEGRDLPVVHDFRDLLAAAIAAQWGAQNWARLFPGYATKPTKGLF
jgi:uncharacterized protein (DUF1501 family)